MMSSALSASTAIDRDLLQCLSRGPASGDALAQRHGLTRAEVWKRIKALRNAGIGIHVLRGQGYVLIQPLDLLDVDEIARQLPAQLAAGLESLQVAWQIASTNSALLAKPAPAQGVRVLLAEQQTAGRGRRGRSWASPLAANLYLSVDRGFATGLAGLSGLSLAAGVAVAEALRDLTGLDIRLKWPNDLWLGEHKLGGLLVEGGGEYAGPARAVIGLGLNVHMPQLFAQQIDQAWTDLASHLAVMPSRNTLVVALLAHLLPALDTFDSEGFAPFLPRWQALDGLAGRTVQVKAAGVDFNAQVLGLAENGGLRVLSENGEQVLHSGEMSVRVSHG